MTEPASPLAGANVRTLTQRLCEVEAVMAVVGGLSATLRAEVTSRAIARWAEDGAAPTYRVPGFGVISLSVPQQKVVIDDPAEFASWVAQRYPTEVATEIVVTGVPTGDLEDALERFATVVNGGELIAEPTPPLGLRVAITAKVTVSPAFASRLLERDVVVADSGDTRAVIDKGTGEVVAGVQVIPGADPDNPDAPRPRSISVRLDPQAKADAEAQAQARLVTVLEAGLAPALAAEVHDVPDMPAMVDLDAVGEPDEDEICACGHRRFPPADPPADPVEGVDRDDVGHAGAKGGGRCSVTSCGCKRFRVAAVAW